jgi:hypothetical protein
MNRKEPAKSSPALMERNRIALAYLELAKDKLFRKIPEAEKMKLIEAVLAVGDEAARRAVKEYGTSDPRKIAEKMGVRVLGEGKPSLLRSEYRREKKEIAVSRRFHEKLLREVESKELSENLLKFIVAHELFHHIEADRLGVVYRRYRFRVWKIGPFSREKYIEGLSDVAAQAFTQTLLGLDISPTVFDYITYMLYTRR